MLLVGSAPGARSTVPGLTRHALALWMLLGVALSTINLPVAGLLVNPGGTVLPAAFGGIVLGGTHGIAPWRVVVAAVGTAAALTLIPAWSELNGVYWQAQLVTGLVAGAIGAGLTAGVGEAVGACSLALVIADGLRLWSASAGWLPWPASLGGGGTFDAAVLAIGTVPLAAWASERSRRRASLGAGPPTP